MNILFFFLLVVIGDLNGKLEIFSNDTFNLSNVISFQAHSAQINRIKQSPFNTYVATASGDKTSKIWNVTTISNWVLIQTYSNHLDQILALEYINEDTIATGDINGTIQIWSISTGLTNLTLNTNIPVWSLKLLSNGYYLACGLVNKINIYNIFNGNLISTISSSIEVNDLVLISSDLLASSGNDNKVYIYNLTTNSLKFTLIGHTDCTWGLTLVSTDVLASGSFDNTTKLWNTTSGELIRTLIGHTNRITWSIDMFCSNILVSGSSDQTLKFWDWSTGEVLNTINTGLNIRSLTVLKSSISSENIVS